MTKETEEKVEKVASDLEALTNVCGLYHESLGLLAQKMAHIHHTLTQSFTSGFILPFVREMARQYQELETDERNYAAADICNDMQKKVEEGYGPGEIHLPCV